jgi:heme o synthase
LDQSTLHINQSVTSIQRILAFYKILKLRLSALVAFSAGIGYLLGTKGEFSWAIFIVFTIAGLGITGASNIINQIIERNSDKLMLRTQNRPLPTGVLSVFDASIICRIFINSINVFNDTVY